MAEHALWYAPGSAELYVERGLALHALGRNDDAAIAYRQALRLAPDMASAQHGLERLGGA